MATERKWLLRPGDDDCFKQIACALDRWPSLTVAGLSDETGIDEYYLVAQLLPRLVEAGRIERFKETDPDLPGGPIKFNMYRLPK